MNFLYNFAIQGYELAINIASNFNTKAQLLANGRKQSEQFIKQFQRSSKPLIWFHAASLGEFEQGRPLIEEIKKSFPQVEILLTFFSPSGYEIRKDYKGADYILYLPADTPKKAKEFVDTFRPDIAVFIKYEYWYNFLNELHQQHIKTYIISALFREHQPFFKPWGKLHKEMLHFFNQIYVQDQKSVDLLSKIDIDHVTIAGDTRFDRVKQIALEERVIPEVEEFCQGKSTIVCGSTWPQDEDLLLHYINEDQSDYKWIIAPHEIGEAHVKQIISKCKRKVVRFSDKQANLSEAKVLIIDCIGLLSAIYRYGSIAYIGGGFGAGIHNTLEAAVYGIPVIFGPKYKKFNEAIGLVDNGGAFDIVSQKELDDLLNSLIGSDTVIHAAGSAAKGFVDSQLGATNILMQEISNSLK